MGFVFSVVIGFVAGVLAKWIVSGWGPGGFFVTLLLGVAGAALGGFVAGLLAESGATGFNVGSVVVAAFEAISMLFVYNLVSASEP
ncbi:MAG: GlsB/YeaQ/YmgE family stress response membrane protein [Rubrobacteraceae bacterium]